MIPGIGLFCNVLILKVLFLIQSWHNVRNIFGNPADKTLGRLSEKQELLV